jgi:hypothetical protein
MAAYLIMREKEVEPQNPKESTEARLGELVDELIEAEDDVERERR